jgi:hypothetical protein
MLPIQSAFHRLFDWLSLEIQINEDKQDQCNSPLANRNLGASVIEFEMETSEIHAFGLWAEQKRFEFSRSHDC